MAMTWKETIVAFNKRMEIRRKEMAKDGFRTLNVLRVHVANRETPVILSAADIRLMQASFDAFRRVTCTNVDGSMNSKGIEDLDRIDGVLSWLARKLDLPE